MPLTTIYLTTGETITTSRHTYAQVVDARNAGQAVEVGGPSEQMPGEGRLRTIYAEAIAAVEESAA